MWEVQYTFAFTQERYFEPARVVVGEGIPLKEGNVEQVGIGVIYMGP